MSGPYEKLIDDHSQQDQLEFQNFILNEAEQNLNKTEQHPNPPPPPPIQRPNELGFATDIETGPKASSHAFWQLEYYMVYFNVDTNDVFSRMRAATLPINRTFISTITSNPDLYGPFWISTTLVFLFFVTTIIGKSIADYANHESHGMDFSLLPSALATVYTYAAVVPSLVWGLGKYFGFKLNWLDAINVYGYGLTVWLPAACICIAPIELLRWVTVLAAFAVSAYFMLGNLALATLECGKKSATSVTLGFMLIAHLALAIIFKTRFFNSFINYSGKPVDQVGT